MPKMLLVLLRKEMAWLLGSYSKVSASSFTFLLVSSEISGWFLSALETVEILIFKIADSCFSVACSIVSKVKIILFWLNEYHFFKISSYRNILLNIFLYQHHLTQVVGIMLQAAHDQLIERLPFFG